MNPISVKIVFINICEKFQRNFHPQVWKGLIGWYKLEPQGRIVAATFFPAVQYLLGIRAGQPVHFPLFRVQYLSDIRAGLFVHFPLFRVCTTSPPFAPVHILQSAISPPFVPACTFSSLQSAECISPPFSAQSLQHSRRRTELHFQSWKISIGVERYLHSLVIL